MAKTIYWYGHRSKKKTKEGFEIYFCKLTNYKVSGKKLQRMCENILNLSQQKKEGII